MYYYYGPSSWSYNNHLMRLQATNLENAEKEVLVYLICDYWRLCQPKIDSIDFNNFDNWLIEWLKTTRYWAIPDIQKKAEHNLPFFRQKAHEARLLRASLVVG